MVVAAAAAAAVAVAPPLPGPPPVSLAGGGGPGRRGGALSDKAQRHRLLLRVQPGRELPLDVGGGRLRGLLLWRGPEVAGEVGVLSDVGVGRGGLCNQVRMRRQS